MNNQNDLMNQQRMFGGDNNNMMGRRSQSNNNNSGSLDGSNRSSRSKSKNNSGNSGGSGNSDYLGGSFKGGWQSNADLPDRRRVIYSILEVIRMMRPDTNRISQK